jgi:hypothetical protein
MGKTINQTIADLYVLAKVVDSEDAERIYEIIELFQSFEKYHDDQNNIYVEILRS